MPNAGLVYDINHCRSGLAREEAGTGTRDLQPAETTRPASTRALFPIHPALEPNTSISVRIGAAIGIFGCFSCSAAGAAGLAAGFRRCFGNRWLVGQRLERYRQLFGEFLQQYTLCLNLSRRAAGVLFLQVNDAVIANLATTVDQTPLRIEDRRLRLPRIQARDGQQHLDIRREA